MVGSPNYIFMVYDGDESGFPAPVPIPAGSVAIEDLFESFFNLSGEPYDDAEFSGRSDYEAFILADIPAGGLFTGAEGIKTEKQAAIWGGTIGAQYDPCFHAACDTFDNVRLHALGVNTDAEPDISHTLERPHESVQLPVTPRLTGLVGPGISTPMGLLVGDQFALPCFLAFVKGEGGNHKPGNRVDPGPTNQGVGGRRFLGPMWSVCGQPASLAEALCQAGPRDLQQRQALSNGGPGGNRTLNLGIKSPLLCRLSYRPVVFLMVRETLWH